MERAKKPVYKHVWFWLPAIAALIAVASWLRSPEVMFRLNRGKFEQAAQDMLAERETDVKIFGVHDIDIWGFDDGAMVEFTTGGFGIAPASFYSGVYYSADGGPKPFQNSDNELIPDGDGWVWQEADSDNRGETYPLGGGWYTFEAGL